MSTVATKDETPVRGSTSHARELNGWWFVKLAVMAVINAGLLYAVYSSFMVRQWWILAVTVVLLVVVNWVYFSKRMVPAKYLLPGVIFLLVYQVFTMGYTAYIAFTNYGSENTVSRDQAIEQILRTGDIRVEGALDMPLKVVRDEADQLGFAVVVDGEVQVGTAEQPLEPVDGATIGEGGAPEEIPGWRVLNLAEVLEVQGEVTELRVPFSDDPADGWVRTQTGAVGFQSSPRYSYDAAADAFTDITTGTVYIPNDRGFFEAEDGTRLTPGWPVTIGFENFQRMLTDSRISSALLQAGAWTFAFAFLSVATTFFLGLFLAMTFNHPAVRGRTLIRSLLILPYAFPGFLAALVWRGMLNNPYGFINSTILGGADIPWLTEEWLARFSIIAVNLWLGFPYMFLIATGALQAVPGDVYEAAKIDGAKPFRQFRSITLPLLMISVAPLLIASFSFNFNNFNLIYFVTEGGPNIPGHPLALGETDILISVVYKVAVVAGTKQYGLAAAMSILIFVIVGLVSWLGFRQTRKLEEVL